MADLLSEGSAISYQWLNSLATEISTNTAKLGIVTPIKIEVSTNNGADAPVTSGANSYTILFGSNKVNFSTGLETLTIPYSFTFADDNVFVIPYVETINDVRVWCVASNKTQFSMRYNNASGAAQNQKVINFIAIGKSN